MGLMPKTGVEARALGLKRYWSDRPCHRGHFGAYDAANNTCMGCLPLIRREQYLKHKEKRDDYSRKRYVAKRDVIRERQRDYNKKVSARNVQRATAWAEGNKDRVAVIKRGYKKRNPDKVRADGMARIARKLNATPAWADNSKIQAVYTEALRISRLTGVKHHVDHIVPLRGRNVCGLHVAENLQIIPASENHRKSNKFLG